MNERKFEKRCPGPIDCFGDNEVFFRKVLIPTTMGDDRKYPPENGAYRNALVVYEANGAMYLYSSDGLYTKLDVPSGVTSVNGMYGDVVLDIPDKTSELENDAGFITKDVNNLTNYTKTSGFSRVAFTGSYLNLSDRPAINDGTLLINRNGSTVGTFKANQSESTTVNIRVPVYTNDLINNSQFVVDGNYVHTDNNFNDEFKNKLAHLANITEIGDNLTLTNGRLDANGGSGGTYDHSELVNRDLPDQHPISAITGLRDDLDYINNNLGAIGVQLNTKQDELVSGDNIKTINNQSILGEGNLEIVGGEKFENDITLAGNWSQVGNLTKSQTGTKTYAAAGKTPVEVLTDILSQDANPTTVQPSGSISLAHSGNVEVGNTIAISVTTSFNPGSYTYDSSTGVTASSYAFTDTKSHSDTNTAGNTTFNNYSLLVEDGTNYTASVAISYTAGNIPHTQLGNEYPAGQIQAGTINKTSSAIKGIRYMFNGANTEVKTLNSTNIRALSGANPSNNFNITIPQNCVQVIIAFPKSLNKTLSKVEDVGAFGTDIKARFEKSTVSVEGASSYTAVDYDVWEYLPATKLDANTYRVTMS